MDVARVLGSAVATAKHERLTGRTLLLVAPATPDAKPLDAAYIAIDAVGAGVGQLVLVTRGSAARLSLPDEAAPVDAAVVAIVDRIDVDGSPTYVAR